MVSPLGTSTNPVSVTNPVNFVVQFHAQADVSTFTADVDGTPIPATASGPAPAPGTQSTATAPFPTLAAATHVFHVYCDFLNGNKAFDGLGEGSTFTIVGPPPLAFLPSSLLVTPCMAPQTVSVQLPSVITVPVSVTLTPQNANSTINGLGPGAATVVSVSPGTPVSFTVTALTVGGSGIDASGSAPQGTLSGSLPVSIPGPSVSLGVTPSSRTVVWGNSASYDVQVTGSNCFAGTMSLSATNLPFGAHLSSFPSVTLAAGGPPQTSTLTVSTDEAATAPGRSTFNIQGSGQAATAALVVRRTPGTVTAPIGFVTGPSMCGPVNATIDPTARGPAVDFHLGTRDTQDQVFSQGYSISPHCRVGVVAQPVDQFGHTWLSFFKLGFPIGTHNNPPVDITDQQLTYENIYLSPDESVVVVAGAGTTTPPGTFYGVNEFDLVADSGRGMSIQPCSLSNLDGPISSIQFFTGKLGNPPTPTSADLPGSQLQVNYTDRNNQPSSFTCTIGP